MLEPDFEIGPYDFDAVHQGVVKAGDEWYKPGKLAKQASNITKPDSKWVHCAMKFLARDVKHEIHWEYFI